MNRRELVNVVAAHAGLEPKQVDTTLKSVTEVITAVVAKGEPVNISGFAKFAKVERPARMGRNPATGEAIKIKASKKARITPLKGFKDSVMTPSQAPKLAKGVWPAAGGTKAAAKAAPAKADAGKATASKAAPAKAGAKSAAKASASGEATAKAGGNKSATSAGAKKTASAGAKKTTSEGAKKTASAGAKKTASAGAKKTATATKKAPAKKR